jgi:transglutaminase-like putative cysteine protease
MRLSIRHDTDCRFVPAARNLSFILRLCPRSHEGQHVSDWRIDADIDCSLRTGQDAFGNITHAFSAVGPIDQVRVSAIGEVDTFDMTGIVNGTAEPLPQDIFLRETPLTAADDRLRSFADGVTSAETNDLGRLHAILDALYGQIAFDADEERDDATAARAFERRRGGSASHAHMFMACARHIGLPSRFVSGYWIGEPGSDARCHAWSEAFVPGLGWVGFDTVSNKCPEDGHIRVAVGLDALGAAFIRGTRHEDIGQRLTLRVLG